MKLKFPAYLACILLLVSCKRKEQADLIVFNGRIYTVNEKFDVAEAFAVKGGKVLAVGTAKEILDTYESPEKVDMQGMHVYPGFIDAHCHFYGYGMNLGKVALEGTGSWNEVVQKVSAFAAERKSSWILGRGWDQNDWDVKSFPDKTLLDSLFPSTPVFLQRIDGHAAVVNSAALQRAGITGDTKISGGEIILKNDQPSGVLIDNAVELVEKVIPRPGSREIAAALLEAQKNCFAVGLTTVDDAGLDRNIIELMDSLQKENQLKMRVYAMINPSAENKAHYFKHGKYKTDRLNACSFKIYADGALGSRGACLLHPYNDKPDHTGFLLQPLEYFSKTAEEMDRNGFQMNTHCIGDSANRYVLKVYAGILKGKNNRRWRIEHAQVLSGQDFSVFGDYSIIPSIQTTHATSDMYWAEARIGERVKNAYAYKQLMEQNGMLANGSDFPVENINPLYGYYAAVVRKDHKNYPAGGFQPENALSRKDALKAMTIWAAYANFEENEKGSIEPGKFADFVVMEDDLMEVSGEKLWQLKVIQTYSNGEKVFERK